ncbi:hypothetical protein V8017_13215 [Stenotrophomonas rhizophila]
MSTTDLFWSAESVSAAAAAASVAIAAGVFIFDRFSSWSRRRADARRLSGIIAGDIGLLVPKFRTQASFFNRIAVQEGHETAVQYLVSINDFDSAIEDSLADFNIDRIARIVETSGVFSPAVSSSLSNLVFLREAAVQTAKIVKATPLAEERGDAVFNMALQMNMLQHSMVDYFNSHISSIGAQRMEETCLLTGTPVPVRQPQR